MENGETFQFLAATPKDQRVNELRERVRQDNGNVEWVRNEPPYNTNVEVWRGTRVQVVRGAVGYRVYRNAHNKFRNYHTKEKV